MKDTEIVKECVRLVPLGPWLERAAKAKIPFIPAVFSPEFPTSQIMGTLSGETTPQLDRAWIWASDQIQDAKERSENVMARWECCCDDWKKSLAVESPEWSPEWTAVIADDERVIDCTVGATTRLCVRPWQTPHLYKGARVEFRVFFNARGYQGVSNYYPQFPLPEDNWYINRAVSLVLQFAWRLHGTDSFPVGFTADFMVVESADERDDTVVFLEGGPPHWYGEPSAHPCCFMPGFTQGIALSPRPGALTR